MKKNKSIIIGIVSIFLVMLVLIGLTYAYYRTRVIGNTSTEKSVSVKSEKLEIVYADQSPNIIVSGAEPSETVYTKTFSVTNTGTEDVVYNIKLDNKINTFIRTDWTYKLYSGRSAIESNLLKEGLINNYNVQYILSNITIEHGEEPVLQEYYLEINYPNKEEDQSIDMEKQLSLRVNIDDKLELLSKNQEIKVGDYVLYEYNTATYKIDAGKTGWDTEQTYNSGTEDAKHTLWRVLSVDNGEIKITPSLPETSSPVKGVRLYGAAGFANGANVLNEMSKTLYSGEYGTARSFNITDIEESLITPMTKYTYLNASGSKVTDEEITTLEDYETKYGNIDYRVAPTGLGIDLKDAELNHYGKSELFFKYLDRSDSSKEDSVMYRVLVGGSGDGTTRSKGYINWNVGWRNYWLANSIYDLDENLDDLGNSGLAYRLYAVSNAKILLRALYYSDGTINTGVLSDDKYYVRPVVTLNDDLLYTKGQIDINEDGKYEGTLETNAWVLAK